MANRLGSRQRRRVREVLKFTDLGRCQYCGRSDDLTIDHIVPLASGGRNSLFNLQTLCRQCNQRKGSRLEKGRPKTLLELVEMGRAKDAEPGG
jgi:5-methylcytosine-specific restriction endonuclease McrA